MHTEFILYSTSLPLYCFLATMQNCYVLNYVNTAFTIKSTFQLKLLILELYVWLDQIHLLEAKFKYLLVVTGLEFVMMVGMIMKQVWCVDNWDLEHQGK